MKTTSQVIADAIRPRMSNPAMAGAAAQAAVDALTVAGFTIIRRRPGAGPVTVVRGPGPRPVLTNAVAGEGGRRGVFAKEDES